MINIYKKIYIHPLYYLFLLIVLLTANIRPFIEFSIIILTHELGHIITALILKWRISKIVILPYGMITFFSNSLSKPIIQELLILIMGPLTQLIFNIYFKSTYSNIILFINLLPIYPLDGSKIVFLFFNKVTTYYKSYIYTYLISFITIIYLFLNYHSMLIILMLIYLLYHLIDYLYHLNETIISFCYERFKTKFYTTKYLIINGPNIKLMHRDRYHFFKINKKCVKEADFMLKMFDK
ncbi:MAG: hypothetical protein IKN87_02445 [Bacilli bacterium]|nr:hypothetical protein [Bacilli bacterium]